MAYYKDVREYLKALEEHGKLVRVTRAINKDTEMHPLVRLQYRGLPEEERRAFLFERVGVDPSVWTILVQSLECRAEKRKE
jgi:UbiD family decarboxylase